MKKSKNKTLFFASVMTILIIGVAIMFGNQEANDVISLENTNNSENNNINDNFSGSIYYLLKASDGSEIYSIDEKKNPKLIFSDKDEKFKIKSANSITSNGKILALVSPEGQEFGGSLILIDSSNPGEYSEILGEFASTQSPIISPNGKKIAYIIFSNIETDYGFSLYVMDINGENKQKITNDPVSVKILSWNSDSSKIAYLKGNINEESTIYASDLNGNENKISSYKEKINSLDWKNDMMFFSKGPISGDEISKTEIYSMTDNGKNIKRITSDESTDSFSFTSPDNKYTCYLSADYNQNIDTNKSGQIKVSNVNQNDSHEEIIEANYIIGWIK